ncbi:MAG TPA: (d)CMP kinase [Candidatus Eremiobacteraceae bacterium]|nr:(d)CMP kinase [Candidatus Eremiobacteraceae bacterium]
MPPLHIAIDGPVASGKSTVARLLAQRLACAFLDTGALYRAVAFAVIQRGISPEDERSVASLVEIADPKVVVDAKTPLGYRIRIDGRVLGDELFSPTVSQAVSAIAANAAVRKHLVGAQRSFAEGRDVIMAGRDIGSVVLPDATFKFFLTASVDARVERRLRELLDKGVAIDRETLKGEIERRDERDRTRKASPLVIAPDAVVIDSSELTVEQVVDRLETLVRKAQPA